MSAALMAGCDNEAGGADAQMPETHDGQTVEQPDGQMSGKDGAIDFPTPTVEAAPAGNPFLGTTDLPLDSYGYEEHEYFFRGVARSYTSADPLGPDGKWRVEANQQADYSSRMVVYRPADADNFNGTVILEWLNVSAGVDTAAEWIILHTELLRRGYAWVGVSAQQVGIEGGDPALPFPISLFLKDIDPERYGSLSHPGDSFSYDVFAQAAQAIRSSEVAILGDLVVERLIAAGQSQAATRLVTFVNALGPGTELFDGYFIHSRLRINGVPIFQGASAPLSQAPQEEIFPGEVVLVREDLETPVMMLQTETDVAVGGSHAVRQADTDRYRLWEVAGTAHADTYLSITGRTDEGGIASAEVQETTRPGFLPACVDPVASAPQHHFVAKAALAALNRWIDRGQPPPSAARLEYHPDDETFARDPHGNALGGVRSAYVDVPIATHSGQNSSVRNDTDICFLFGSTQLLEEATLRALYPDREAYVAAVRAAVDEAVDDGFLLKEDGEIIVAAASASTTLPF